VYLLPAHSTRFSAANVDAELSPIAEQHERLWLASFERALQDPDDVVADWLDSHRVRALEVMQDYNYLRLYLPPTAQGAANAVGLADEQPDRPARYDLGRVELLGLDLPTREFRPGDVMRPALYVRTRTALSLDLGWIARDGREIATSRLEAEAGAGQMLRLVPSLRVYAFTPPGRYTLRICEADNLTACAEIEVGRVTHSKRLPVREPAMQRQAQIAGGAVTFLGYRMHPERRVRAGTELTVELYWRANQPLDTDYTVFVHLLGPYNPSTGGPVWAQDDSAPLGGEHPTTRWLVGESVPDRHTLAVPDLTPAGMYAVEVGLYDARTGARLDVAGNDENRILLDNVEIIRRNISH